MASRRARRAPSRSDAHHRNGASPAAALAARLGLRYVSADSLTIRRRRAGQGWSYVGLDKRVVRDKRVLRRVKRLAVPPAYRDVYFAHDPNAHLQAIGRDAAGRLQYRYHPTWEKVRETGKANRLAHMAEALPRVLRCVARHLSADAPCRELAFAAVIDLVARSAIRSGRESYARQNGTRGAATLLKTNVAIEGDDIVLGFRAKGGKDLHKRVTAPKLAAALTRMRDLPGRRMFQYRAADGTVRAVKAREVNDFLRELARAPITLKDFRTLLASLNALKRLACVEPARAARTRRKQVLAAIRAVAEDLGNTPAICRRSYIHRSVVDAFKSGALVRVADTLKACRSDSSRAQVLAEIMSAAKA